MAAVHDHPAFRCIGLYEHRIGEHTYVGSYSAHLNFIIALITDDLCKLGASEGSFLENCASLREPPEGAVDLPPFGAFQAVSDRDMPALIGGA